MNATPAKRDTKQEVGSLREMLEKQTSQFAMLMPPETVDKFKRIFWTTVNDKPDLMRCDPRSLMSVCMHAAQDGLYLDGREAAIVPYKDKSGNSIATYQPMVIGLRKKVRASDEIYDWQAQVVFEGDPFDIGFGDRPHLHHKPALSGSSHRKIVGAYSIAWFKDGGFPSIEWMTFEQIEETRKASPAVKAGRPTPWDNWYSEMARKAVTRRHSKMLPMSREIETIFRHEEQSRDDVGDNGSSSPPPDRIAFQPGAERSVADTLDDFASGSPPPEDSSAARNVDRDERGGGAPAVGQPATISQSKAEGAADTSDLDLPSQEQVDEARERGQLAAQIAAAWERGKTDHKRGAQRKAIPGEYRENPKLYNAWLDGYDDVARPLGA
jgi:recombination protein RecT